MAYIVVSDVHLGDESSNHDDFSKFIDWIAALEKNGGRSIKSGEKEIILSPPEKLILLGDILELWSPQGNDMKFTVQRAFEPFGKLVGLECEKIFVLGNHDEDISEYLDIKLNDGSGVKENTFKVKSNFTVINRHYPEDPHDETKGFLHIGNDKYFFIHGQQFDRLFISVGPLANIPTYIAKISSAFSRIFPLHGWSVVIVFAILLVLYFINITKSQTVLPYLQVTFILSIPRLFTYLQDKVWANIKGFFTDKPKYKDVQTIIQEKYYDFNKDTTGTDVNLIFGHTHVPEIYPYKFTIDNKEHEMLFVNSGSWVREEKFAHNTFVYIDETGSYLFKWNCGSIELIPREIK